MKKSLLLASGFLSFVFSFAQNYSTSADIYLGLKKLNVLGSFLYIAAHPDDENTRLLTYFSKDRLYRTGYLSLTRGDGGQNLIGEEQGIELGLIRTQELLAARRIDGAEQFFSRAYDFGYSKTPQETFTKWDREKILSDVVWVIRKFQPDVIITRFPTTGEGGHGQHTASAILANEAFTAAADPKRFPEQLKWVQPWQTKRILWNSFNFNNAAPPTDAFRLDVGGYNPVLGKSYGEIAADSRSQHKSQGFGVPRSRGEVFEYFSTTGGNAPANDLFEDVDLSWERVKGGKEINRLITKAIASFDFMQPQKIVPQLVDVYKNLNALPQSYWRDQKIKEVKDLIEAASGLWLEAYTSQQYAVQGDSIRINFVLNDRLGAGAKLERVSVAQFDSSFSQHLEKNKNLNFFKSLFVIDSTEITQPYWLRNKMEEGYFNVSEQQLIGQPDVQVAYTITFDLSIAGEKISFTKPVKYKFTDQVKGEIYQPVFIIPSVTVYASPEILLFGKEKKSENILVQVNANRKISGSAEVHARSASYNVVNKDSSFALNRNAAKNYTFSLNGDKLGRRTVDNLYGFMNGMDGKKEVAGYLAMRSINYDHIPSIRYFYGDNIKILNIDLKTAGKKVGYIIGAGDKIPEALEQMGYEVTLLTEKEISRNNLQQFDAIIAGVRTHNANGWMPKYYDKLMKYVENGGNYIVQYSQANNLPGGKMGPYNFSVVSKRITDENAPVSFIKPEHRVLNYPNKITQDDFKGWVQERSIYHADKLDSNFQTILRMNDPGEGGEDGALVIAKYGKGYFTYTGLVFFRQLPAGVPGAYRLMANLIALNSKNEF